MFYDKHKSIFRGTVGSVGPSFVEIEMVSKTKTVMITLSTTYQCIFLCSWDHDICLADFPDCMNFQQQFSSKMSSKIFFFQSLLLDETLQGTERYILIMMCLIT